MTTADHLQTQHGLDIQGERHSHPEFRYCEDCGKLLPEDTDKGYPFCGASCEDRYLGVGDGED